MNSQVTDDPEATLPTRIAAAMLKAAEDHPECHDGVRLVVLVSDVTASGAEASAICANGFPDNDGGAEMLATAATGVAMLFEVHGIQVKFAPQPLADGVPGQARAGDPRPEPGSPRPGARPCR